jgi:hypothetical protein
MDFRQLPGRQRGRAVAEDDLVLAAAREGAVPVFNPKLGNVGPYQATAGAEADDAGIGRQ